MGENDVQTFITLAEGIRSDIRDFRKEHLGAVTVLHGRLNGHEERLVKIEVNCAARSGLEVVKEEERRNPMAWLGSLKTKRGQVTGLAAIVLIVGLFLCIFKWGPDLVRSFSGKLNKPIIEKATS